MCDDNCNSLWPEVVPTEVLVRQKEEARLAGMLDVWYREMRNIPIALDDQGFKPDYFHYWNKTPQEIKRDSDFESLVLCDPARTMKTGSCKTALVGISANMRTNEIYVQEAWEGFLSPATMIDEMFAMADRIGAFVLAPEVSGLEDFIIHPIRDAMLERNKHYVILPIHPRQGKKSAKRSAGLIPMYRNGHIFHNKATCGALEKYLLQWPRPSSWDIIDALANMIAAFEEGGRYFSFVGDDEEDAKKIEAEYAELDYDEPFEYETVI